ncbi:phage major capsid protein, partial [Escherichia coli]|nr:phage major capsid protein [Escherichia coli]
GGAAGWVGEGKAKPLTKFDFESITFSHAKVSAIAVLTEELIRFSSPAADALVRNALAEAVVARLDTDFVDPKKAAVADVSPASITHDVKGKAS